MLLGVGLTSWQRWSTQRALADVKLWLDTTGEPPPRLTFTNDRRQLAAIVALRLDPHEKRIVAVHSLGSAVRISVCAGPAAHDIEVEVRPDGAVPTYEMDRGDRVLCQSAAHSTAVPDALSR